MDTFKRCRLFDSYIANKDAQGVGYSNDHCCCAIMHGGRFKKGCILCTKISNRIIAKQTSRQCLESPKNVCRKNCPQIRLYFYLPLTGLFRILMEKGILWMSDPPLESSSWKLNFICCSWQLPYWTMEVCIEKLLWWWSELSLNRATSSKSWIYYIENLNEIWASRCKTMAQQFSQENFDACVQYGRWYRSGAS